MKRDLNTIFSSNTLKPRPNLESDILHKIYIRNSRKIAFKFWASVFVGISSIVGLFPVSSNLSSQFKQSGFYDYVSLIFSNGAAFSKYSHDLIMAIGESIPGVSVIIFLLVVLVLLWSLRNIFRQSRSPYFKLLAN
ncbi:MAG: hypothetical protein KGI58_03805 [Patescibacteria group bacterium]|nr:hypothetical protein [Patescibacteria group bacterium]